jgi:hypothetical protein
MVDLQHKTLLQYHRQTTLAETLATAPDIPGTARTSNMGTVATVRVLATEGTPGSLWTAKQRQLLTTSVFSGISAVLEQI